MARKRTATKSKWTARKADKHVLYQLSVQAPDIDSHFFARYHKKITGKPMRVFREDFCGTAILSCNVVQNHREHRAVGVDLHGPTLAWARKHNLSQLDDEQRERIQLIQDDVVNVKSPRADLTCALNFSYCVFKTRTELLRYFKNARKALRRGGLFVMDAWGGSETQLEEDEEREIETDDGETFTYIWDQHRFDPLTYHITCKIHFEFDDGTRMNNAFVYDWRLWTLPEIRELMEEAGFEDVHVLWENTDRKTNEGNGVFRRVQRGEADPAWIAYVVGVAG